MKAITAVLDFLFPRKVSTFYVVGRGIPAEETACDDFFEALGVASEFARSRHVDAFVCEVRAKVGSSCGG